MAAQHKYVAQHHGHKLDAEKMRRNGPAWTFY